MQYIFSFFFIFLFLQSVRTSLWAFQLISFLVRSIEGKLSTPERRNSQNYLLRLNPKNETLINSTRNKLTNQPDCLTNSTRCRCRCGEKESRYLPKKKRRKSLERERERERPIFPRTAHSKILAHNLHFTCFHVYFPDAS